MDLGDRFVSTTFYTKFTTVNGSGVPTTIGNSPSLEFYVGAGSTAFTVGLSLDVDFNSRTGLNMVSVIATSSATAWTSGIDVQVVLATGSVSGVAMKGYKVCEFSLNNRAALRPATAGRNLIVESDGMAYADVREWLGGTIATPTVTGVPEVDVTHWIGTAAATPTVAGVPEVDVTHWLGTAAATPTTAGVPEVDLTHWLGVAPLALSSQQVQAIVPDTQKVDVNTIKTNPVVNGGTITFPTNATLASTTNITGGTITTVTTTTTATTVTNPVTVGTNNDKTDYVLSATGSAALTEGYAADGATFTLNQGLYMIWSLLAERAISGTTLTASKLDGTTASMTFTLDDATTPNSQTRAT